MRRGLAIVAGGGLAGSAFALELARNGHRVLVLEATRQAHHKVCGEFLSAETKALLAYLGIDAAAIGASRVETLRLIAGRERAQAPLPFEGAGLSRYLLDEALLAAAGRAGADIERGTTVTAIDVESETVSVRAGAERREAGAAALATGKHGLRQFPRGRGEMVGLKLHVEVRPAASPLLDRVVQLAMFDGGYVGACTVEGGVVPLCWVMEASLVKRIGGAGWAEQAEHLSRTSELMGDLLSGAKPLAAKPVAISGIPYGFLRREPIADAVYPLGDQLAVIPSFTGDGIAIALSSGIGAARAVLAGRSAAHYQREMIGRLKPQFRWAGAVNLVFETRRLHRLGVRVAGALPGLVTRLVEATRLRGFDGIAIA